MMAELFSELSSRFPPGFSYEDDFISPEEEELLTRAISQIALHPFNFQGFEAKRKVASFGYDYSFDKRKLTKGVAIPAEFNWLIERVGMQLQIPARDFAELLVTEYPPGAVINWHRDAFPFDVIAGISLAADCVFKLRPDEKEKQNKKAIINVDVRRRSLYVMQGDARLHWQHSTAPVKHQRYSITLRTLFEKKPSDLDL